MIPQLANSWLTGRLQIAITRLDTEVPDSHFPELESAREVIVHLLWVSRLDLAPDPSYKTVLEAKRVLLPLKAKFSALQSFEAQIAVSILEGVLQLDTLN